MTVQSTKSNTGINRTLWNSSFTTTPTSFTASNTNFTIKGHTDCPTTKSDYPNKYFTPGYSTKADVLDYLA
ncbi:hypothetical protein J6P92_05365 [bacterium]|nr:hypothetical protein [bacterium]